jgi:hypothetical protein
MFLLAITVSIIFITEVSPLLYFIFLLEDICCNIARAERIKTPEMQYPIKSDIYAQGEIYNACDGVFTIHQPELMGILYYGKNQYKTENLVHLQVLKMRFGNVGSVWLQNNLEKGVFINYPSEMLKSKGEDI